MTCLKMLSNMFINLSCLSTLFSLLDSGNVGRGGIQPNKTKKNGETFHIDSVSPAGRPGAVLQGLPVRCLRLPGQVARLFVPGRVRLREGVLAQGGLHRLDPGCSRVR